MLLVHRRRLNRGAEVTATDRMTAVNQHTCGRKHGQRTDDALRAMVRRALTVTLRFDDSATAGKLLSSRMKMTRVTMASSTSGLRRGFQLGLGVARKAHVATEATQTTKCTSTGFGRVSTCQTGATTRARRGEPQGGAVVAARDTNTAAIDGTGDGGARAEVLTVRHRRTTATKPSCSMRATGDTGSSRVRSTVPARSRPFGLTSRTVLRTTGGMKPTSWRI